MAAKKAAPKKGMGFKAAQKKVQAQGKSPQQAAAIVAAAAQKASPAAKAANPNLAKVARKGTKKTASGKFVKKTTGRKK